MRVHIVGIVLGFAGEDLGPEDVIEQREDGKWYRVTQQQEK